MQNAELSKLECNLEMMCAKLSSIWNDSDINKLNGFYGIKSIENANEIKLTAAAMAMVNSNEPL